VYYFHWNWNNNFRRNALFLPLKVGNTCVQITHASHFPKGAHSHGLVHNGNSFASPTAAAPSRALGAWHMGGSGWHWMGRSGQANVSAVLTNCMCNFSCIRWPVISSSQPCRMCNLLVISQLTGSRALAT